MIDMQSADLEWRQQALGEDSTVNHDETVLNCLRKRLDAKTITDSPKYGHLRKVVSATLSLPFSNASVERLFSVLKLIKTSAWNRLRKETLARLIHT